MNKQRPVHIREPRLFLTPDDHGLPLLLSDYLSADVQPGHRYEIVGGRVEVFPIPTLPESRLRDFIRDQLRVIEDSGPTGAFEVYTLAPLYISEDPEKATILQADVGCYNDPHPETPLGEQTWQDGFPLLVVEVLHPTTADKDLVRNPPLYLQVPTIREYWIIDPRDSYDTPTMTVYRRRGSRWQKPIEIEAGGTYTTKFLPGFALNLDRRK